MLLSGLLQALGLVAVCVTFNIVLRFGTLNYDMEPITFTIVTFIAGSMALSLFAGPGRLIGQALKNSTTWLYGLFAILVVVFDVYLTKYVSATEMSLFSRMAIPVSFLISVFIFKRYQAVKDIYGVLLVVIGLGLLFYMQPANTLTVIFVLALATGIAQALEIITTEQHKQSVSAHETGNMRDRARVIGFVSFTTSMMFLLLVLAGSSLQHFIFPELEGLNFFPRPIDLVHPASVWIGLIYGIFFSTANRYLFWSASYKLKSDNVLALLAFVPICTYFTEWFLNAFTSINLATTSFSGDKGQMLLIACVVITAGSGLSVFLRIRRDIMKQHSGHLWIDIKRALTIDPLSMPAVAQAAHSLDDYEIIRATLEQTEGNKKAAADLLDIPATTLEVLYKGKGKLSLNAEYAQHISRRYRTRVATRDALTGLLNRAGFLARLRAVLDETQTGTLFYLDLDKFKPVNDTHGHDAGDEVLRQVAGRLEKTLPADSFASRMGGDEFCAFVPHLNEKEAQKLIKAMISNIEAPYTVGKQQITIGVSIGTAHYPDHGKTPEDLIAAGDRGMYNKKIPGN